MSGPSAFVRPRSLRQGAVLVIVCGAVFAAGVVTGTWDGPSQAPAPLSADSAAGSGRGGPAGTQDLPATLSEAMGEGGLEPEDAEEIVSRSGDRWAAFYTEQEYQDFQQTLDGSYVGVGLWVRRTGERRIEVSQVQSGGPADRGGVRAGDLLDRIDGEPVGARPVTEVVSLLRGGGEPGSRVTLGLERDGERREVALRRAVLDAQNVTVGDMGGGVTRITVTTFTRGVGERVREAMRQPRVRRGVAAGGGVVLDLRGNSGGLVAEATRTASAFLDGGLVATYDVRGRQRALFADGGGDTTTPLVVLVDGGTMSAAEMLAGALQDRGRAVVVGSRTFGKGSVQEPSTLADGSVVEVTVGTYRLPSGRTVDGDGVRPDLEVDPAEGREAAEAQARHVLSGLSAA